VQVNTWGTTRLAANALGRLAEDTLRGTALLQTTVLGGQAAVHEPETGLYGTRQDFSFWFT
jgi:hypothetical protein